VQRCEKLKNLLSDDDCEEALSEDVVKFEFGERNGLRVDDGSSREWLFSWTWEVLFEQRDLGRQGWSSHNDNSSHDRSGFLFSVIRPLGVELAQGLA
jgi:hypothetical protein